MRRLLISRPIVALAASSTIIVSAGVATAQTITREAVLGQWVQVRDPNTLTGRYRGHLLANYYLFKSDGTYEWYNEIDSRRGSENKGLWSVKADTLRLRRNTPYFKYRTTIQNQELTLTGAPDVWEDSAGKHIRECSTTYLRFDSLKPLPASTPRYQDCRDLKAPPPPPPLPKAAELVGTWVKIDTTEPINADLDCGKGVPTCAVTTYDTMVVRADSTWSRNLIKYSPQYPKGWVSDIIWRAGRWWINADTLWKWIPTKYDSVYTDGKKVKAQPLQRTTSAWMEDDGQYMIYDGTAYRRVAVKP